MHGRDLWVRSPPDPLSRIAVRVEMLSCSKHPSTESYNKGEIMGINRWSDVEQRKMNEYEAKAADLEDPRPEVNVPDGTQRITASIEPSENPEKQRVVEKLKKLEEN